MKTTSWTVLCGQANDIHFFAVQNGLIIFSQQNIPYDIIYSFTINMFTISFFPIYVGTEGNEVGVFKTSWELFYEVISLILTRFSELSIETTEPIWNGNVSESFNRVRPNH